MEDGVCENVPAVNAADANAANANAADVSIAPQVSFGRDFEQQLSFCVEARATFCNLEPVLVQLIHVSRQSVCTR